MTGPTPNEHGIYPEDDAEHLILPVLRKGWQGMPTAEIALLQTPVGWLSSAGYELSGFAGGGYGLSPKWHNGRGFDTRQEALDDAVKYLRRMANHEHTDAKRINTWLDAMDRPAPPQQLDLFGELAA